MVVEQMLNDIINVIRDIENKRNVQITIHTSSELLKTTISTKNLLQDIEGSLIYTEHLLEDYFERLIKEYVELLKHVVRKYGGLVERVQVETHEDFQNVTIHIYLSKPIVQTEHTEKLDEDYMIHIDPYNIIVRLPLYKRERYEYENGESIRDTIGVDEETAYKLEQNLRTEEHLEQLLERILYDELYKLGTQVTFHVQRKYVRGYEVWSYRIHNTTVEFWKNEKEKHGMVKIIREEGTFTYDLHIELVKTLQHKFKDNMLKDIEATVRHLAIAVAYKVLYEIKQELERKYSLTDLIVEREDSRYVIRLRKKYYWRPIVFMHYADFDIRCPKLDERVTYLLNEEQIRKRTIIEEEVAKELQ